MTNMIGVIAFMVAMTTSGVVSREYPWLNDNDVNVINRTDTSVVLVWQLPKSMDEKTVRDYRLFVSYKRLGYSVRTIEAHHSDPDCSLLLSHCHLKNLVPGQAYSVEINIDYAHNNTILGRADLPFATLDMTEKEIDMVWWLLYAAVPAAIIILMLVAILCFARCCRCWCWRKKKPTATEEGQIKPRPSTASPESSSLDRKYSLQTRQWVKDTVASIEFDPESCAYDEPLATSPSEHYDLPRGLNSPPPKSGASSKGQSQFYLEVLDTPPSPASAKSDGARNRSKSASVAPTGKSKGKKLKKSKTNPNLLAQKESSALGSGDYVEVSEPPKPCKAIKPTKFNNKIHKSASLPRCHQHKLMKTDPTQEAAPASPLSELQQKLQNKLQQQQQGQQPQDGQTTLDSHIYANTNDLNKLKGNARKMFPML